MERTLILVKPDALQRGLAGEVLSRFERRGLRLVGLRLVHIDESLACRHYAEHEGKPPGHPWIGLHRHEDGRAAQLTRELERLVNPL